MNITATLFGQMIVFTVLFWFVKSYLWEPILTTIEDRKARIADGLAASQKGAEDMARAEEEVAMVLKEAKVQAAAIIEQAKTRESQIVEEAKNKALVEAERVKTGAEAELEQEVNRAKDSLRTQIAALALAGASKIVAKEIDTKTHKKVLDDLVSQI
jgi:F-type H+-transporting ATPase subunit b